MIDTSMQKTNYGYRAHKKYASDCALGNDEEQRAHTQLEVFFGCPLTKTKRYDVSDYVSEDGETHIELKTRTCRRDAYRTTMIGQNKVDNLIAKNAPGNQRAFIVFSFTDGMFYTGVESWHVEQWQLNQMGGRRDRGVSEFKRGYAYIPVNLLHKMEVGRTHADAVYNALKASSEINLRHIETPQIKNDDES